MKIYSILTVSKSGKSPGFDAIPVELFKNLKCYFALARILNICFNLGKVSDMWSKGLKTPIPKNSTSDPWDPMMYLDITLAPVAYKLYYGILDACWSIIVNEHFGGFDIFTAMDHRVLLIFYFSPNYLAASMMAMLFKTAKSFNTIMLCLCLFKHCIWFCMYYCRQLMTDFVRFLCSWLSVICWPYPAFVFFNAQM